jgi:tRNA threonylcarbamoyladenosine biosynthesis protein TsaB
MAAILALDTSTEACSCALSIDGLLREKHVVAPRQHAAILLSNIDALLKEQGLTFAQLDAIAWGRGPGSFTGLRIAAGVTQGIAFGVNLPVIPVSTLASLALDAYIATGQTRVFACLDARIDEVYWGLFAIEDGLPVGVGQEHLCKPEAIPPDVLTGAPGWVAAGNGLCYAGRYPTAVTKQLKYHLPELLPRAGHIATIAAAAFARNEWYAAEDTTPVYLRDKVTHQ